MEWFIIIKGFRKIINNNDDSETTGDKLYSICNFKKYKKVFSGFNIKRLLNKKTDDGLNKVLEDFYDYCDYHRIWIEL